MSHLFLCLVLGLVLSVRLLLLCLLGLLPLLDELLPLPHLDARAHDLSELGELLLELVVVPLVRHVLDEEVRVVVLVRPGVPPHEHADLHLLPVDEHPVELVDGARGGLVRLVVDVAVPLAESRLAVADDLAGEDVPEEAERVVQLLVVDALV